MGVACDEPVPPKSLFWSFFAVLIVMQVAAVARQSYVGSKRAKERMMRGRRRKGMAGKVVEAEKVR